MVMVQKAGFQNREDEALLEEGGNSSVRYWYTSTYNVSARNIHRKPMLNLPSSLHIRCRIYVQVNHRYQSSLFELPLVGTHLCLD